MNPDLWVLPLTSWFWASTPARHAPKLQLQVLGYELKDIDKAFQEFKQLADRKKEILMKT